MSFQNDLKSKNPIGREIVFNPVTGNVKSSDFAPFRALESDSPCVQDIIDFKCEQALCQLISFAMGSPAKEVESDIVFRGTKVHTRVTYEDSPEPRIRVLVSN